jgi:quercetin dioxygenase-like cupin family protein
MAATILAHGLTDGGFSMRLIATWTLAVATLLSVTLGSPMAQSPPPAPAVGIKRTPLQKFDVPGTNFETVIGIAEVPPDTSIGRHSHFGIESGYVLEGEATMIIDGQPARTVKVGDSFVVPSGVVHDAKAGPKGAKVLATYVVEKGKQFATPAP